MNYRPDYSPQGDDSPWSPRSATPQPNPVHWSQNRYQKPYDTTDFTQYSNAATQQFQVPRTAQPNTQPQKRSRTGVAVISAAAIALTAGVGVTLAFDHLNHPASGSQVPAPANLQKPGPAKAAPAAPARDAAPAGSVEQVAAKVLPSVVKIQIQTGQASEEGSGIILSSDGLILTNNHVVADVAGNRSPMPSQAMPNQQMPNLPRGMFPGGQLPGGPSFGSQDPGGQDGPDAQDPGSAAPSGRSSGGVKATVTLADGRTAPFTVVGADPDDDVAVIKVQNISGLTPISIGSSKDVRVGQSVVAVGSPLGLQGTVTTGIISALDRPVATGDEQSGQHSVMSAIQTDAPINPGNSGGALVDMNGDLIGVNSAIASLGGGQGSAGAQAGSIGLGFAIPVDQAKRIADQLVSNGTVQHASLGVQLAADDNAQGATVAGVADGSPAAAAGLPKGAVITKVDDKAIDGPDALIAAVRSKAPGDNVALTFNDPSGGSHTVQVTLGQMQS
ncbi:putative serine protease PepD [Mycobacterium sp. MAA66]|uniref:S1C family serine protease n=1 Tax=Mycobacterium sp. MAA66 TaxID=3156297 RepID=UPI00351845C7